MMIRSAILHTDADDRDGFDSIRRVHCGLMCGAAAVVTHAVFHRWGFSLSLSSPGLYLLSM